VAWSSLLLTNPAGPDTLTLMLSVPLNIGYPAWSSTITAMGAVLVPWVFAARYVGALTIFRLVAVWATLVMVVLPYWGALAIV